jgi:hypothetical protein
MMFGMKRKMFSVAAAAMSASLGALRRKNSLFGLTSTSSELPGLSCWASVNLVPHASREFRGGPQQKDLRALTISQNWSSSVSRQTNRLDPIGYYMASLAVEDVRQRQPLDLRRFPDPDLAQDVTVLLYAPAPVPTTSRARKDKGRQAGEDAIFPREAFQAAWTDLSARLEVRLESSALKLSPTSCARLPKLTSINRPCRGCGTFLPERSTPTSNRSRPSLPIVPFQLPL